MVRDALLNVVEVVKAVADPYVRKATDKVFEVHGRFWDGFA